jgi:hypothetical protein
LPGCGRGVTVPHSTEAEPERSKAIDVRGVLVEAGGQADAVGKIESHRRHRRRRATGVNA